MGPPPPSRSASAPTAGEAQGPLAGLTVVDLTRVLAGPFCTLLLHELGARVVKVERPGGGDDARHIGPFVAGRSAYFTSLNHGKESIALDLRSEDDRRIFERLLGRADVLVENFRPGVLERLGFGPEAVRRRHPRLVYASVSGFGHSGPWARRPAYDLVVQALGGVMSITGPPGGPPVRVGTSIGDLTAGLFTALGIVAALYERRGSERGARVDVGMLDCQLAILENAIARWAATGEVPGPLGSRHPSIAPFEAYPTADGPLVIAAGNDLLFAALAEAVERPGLAADPRFADAPARSAHADALHAVLADALRARPRAHWQGRLEAAGIPCAPIQNVPEVLAMPQVQARNMIVHVDQPGAGPLPVPGNPIKIEGKADPPTRPPAPALDADRSRILAWLDEPGRAPGAKPRKRTRRSSR
jgi:CoA:oxalate CoA-transferase